MAETESLTDPMLLAEILEAREELEMASTPEEVDEIRQTNAGELHCSSGPRTSNGQISSHTAL